MNPVFESVEKMVAIVRRSIISSSLDFTVWIHPDVFADTPEGRMSMSGVPEIEYVSNGGSRVKILPGDPGHSPTIGLLSVETAAKPLTAAFYLDTGALLVGLHPGRHNLDWHVEKRDSLDRVRNKMRLLLSVGFTSVEERQEPNTTQLSGEEFAAHMRRRRLGVRKSTVPVEIGSEIRLLIALEDGDALDVVGEEMGVSRAYVGTDQAPEGDVHYRQRILQAVAKSQDPVEAAAFRKSMVDAAMTFGKEYSGTFLPAIPQDAPLFVRLDTPPDPLTPEEREAVELDALERRGDADHSTDSDEHSDCEPQDG